jgi:biotin carboxyl carrier protein
MIKADLNNHVFDIVFDDKDYQQGKINNQAFTIDRVKSSDNNWHILKEGKSYNIEILKVDKVAKQVDLKMNGKLNSVKLSDQFDALLKSLGMDNLAAKKVLELKAPMPGLVLSILANEGDTIAKGDSLLVLEAMKMENIIKSPTEGVIKKIHAIKGNAVEKNQLLISFQ